MIFHLSLRTSGSEISNQLVGRIPEGLEYRIPTCYKERDATTLPKQRSSLVSLIAFTLSFPSFLPSLFLPNVLCDPIDVIWRWGTLFQVMIGRTAFIKRSPSSGFWGSLRRKVKVSWPVYSPRFQLNIIFIVSQHIWFTWHSGRVNIG